ncbi:MAG: type I methionyl aminopeptidase [Armatimonadota bacterium]|nr:type I methionyl aminopeptidase [Armatimonadota bacterium]MDR7452645.1 type I methionyl aminopeptidase [Armatimonadota bacterium]MDR7468170.1 type I methionyl aminopeptidase [Armatimonadota bacterium]MDR7495164.1 type I methionyl aminopeptidase [Armatimonadota bacterium]MDR7505122.1 type I methionyl aminopeptidase [Armatimonadota bacterium]
MVRHMIIVKSPEEVERMRRAGRLAAEALREVARAVRPGVTGAALDRLAETFIRDHGGAPSFKGYRGFPASICVSVNDAVVHGIPDGRPLRPGEIVSIDLGVEVDGFHGDIAVTLPVGEIGPELARLLRVAREALFRGIAAVRAGRHLGDIGVAIQRHAEGAGFSVVRDFAGHGIGRHLHEEPQVPNFGEPGTGPVLRSGMTLAIEPMVNEGTCEVFLEADGWTVRTQDGRPSAHFEHTVAVTDDGADVLTAIPGGVL